MILVLATLPNHHAPVGINTSRIKGNDNDITEKFDFPVSPAKLHEAVRSMLSCGAAFSLREANDTEMKTTFTPYDSDDVLTATVNGSGDESKITLSAQDSSNTGARIMRFATDLAARRRGAKAGAVIGGERTMWDMSEHVEHGFGPVWDSESRILILGSMPSPKSRKAAFYYMHQQNRFWPVMQALFADPADPSDVTGDSLQSRRAFALRHHIALWDVIASCDITGASDASIRNATPNDLTPLLRDAPIARIFTTGAKSAQLYRRLIEPRLAATGITIGMTPLPSTSPANASMRLPALIEAYRLAFQSAGALEMADETVTGL